SPSGPPEGLFVWALGRPQTRLQTPPVSRTSNMNTKNIAARARNAPMTHQITVPRVRWRKAMIPKKMAAVTKAASIEEKVTEPNACILGFALCALQPPRSVTRRVQARDFRRALRLLLLADRLAPVEARIGGAG